MPLSKTRTRFTKDPRIFRLVDANFNRAKEGLRVCEDISRFIWDNRSLTRKYKDARHALSAALAPMGWRDRLEARNAGGDVGRESVTSEFRRRDPEDIFYANSQRVKESLRVLEEFAKLFDQGSAEALKDLRYRTYVLEQDAMTLLRQNTARQPEGRRAGPGGR